MAAAIMMAFTPATTAKNASRHTNTMRPVSCFDVFMVRSWLAHLWPAEIIDRACPLSGLGVGDPEPQRDRGLFGKVRIGAHQGAHLVRLIRPDRDQHSAAAGRGRAHDFKIEIGQAL